MKEYPNQNRDRPSDNIPCFSLEDMALDGEGFTRYTLEKILDGDSNVIINFDASSGQLSYFSSRDIALIKQRIVTVKAMLQVMPK